MKPAYDMCRRAADYLYSEYLQKSYSDKSVIRAVNLLDMASSGKWNGVK